jgi:hypothetical protein
VPRYDRDGQPLPAEQVRLMHTTVQTLGRVAIIGGSVLVALVNVVMFSGVEALAEPDKVRLYARIYEFALVIPLISVAGVVLAGILRRRELWRLAANGLDASHLQRPDELVAPSWWILGGSLAFVIFTVTIGLSDLRYGQEAIFLGSFGIISFLMGRLLRELDDTARRTLLGTAIVIFVFRATPGPGAGSTWWMIDELGFDQAFLSQLSLIASALTLVGLFLFRRFMAERSIAYIVIFLTLASTVLSLPIVGMYYGLHEWTAAVTGGVVDARFIALVDTALESPLGQISMVPMLAWIANSAPAHLKATFFAVMASFTNLALSAAQLGTKYLNQIYTVSREVRDPASGAITVPADYSDLGLMLITVTVIGVSAPLLAIGVTRLLGLRSA